MTETMTGGCQCGRIRYRATLQSRDAYFCHCRMCQRAGGNIAMAFVGLPRSAIAWETEPDWYASSPFAERGFCSTCGTPLAFRYTDDESDDDLTVGSFDDPSVFVPTHHYGVESMRLHWRDTAGLPKVRSDANARLAARWARAGHDD